MQQGSALPAARGIRRSPGPGPVRAAGGREAGRKKRKRRKEGRREEEEEAGEQAGRGSLAWMLTPARGLLIPPMSEGSGTGRAPSPAAAAPRSA